MRRVLLAIFGLSLLQSAASQPLVARMRSLELEVFRSDAVAVGTLESYQLSPDAQRITSAAFRVDEVLKGSLGPVVSVVPPRAPATFLDWIEGKSRALLFMQDGSVKAVPISGPVPQVMLADLTTFSNGRDIVAAARRIALQDPPSRLGTVQLLVPFERVRTWRDVGTMLYLEVPITEEMHRWAIKAVHDPLAHDRDRAIRVLGHFGTEQDVALLRALLSDTSVAYIDAPRSMLGHGKGTYFLRQAAFSELTKLGVDVEPPQFGVVAFEPDEVTYAYLDRDPGGREKLKSLLQFRNLDRVFAADIGATDRDMELIGSLTQLTELHLSGNPLTDSSLSEIARLQNLQQLDLSRTAVTDAGLIHLVGLGSLEYLDLSRTQVSDAGLAHIAKLTHLKSLNVAGTKVTLEGLKALSKLEHLEEIEGVGIDWQHGEDHFQALASMGLLHTHSAARIEGDRRATRDTDVKEFWLYSAPVGDELIEALLALDNLEELSLAESKVTDRCLRDLAQFKRLSSLIMNGTRVTDSGMRALSEIEGLRSLGIANTVVGDDGLSKIAKLSNLEWLAISGTKVTDAGLAHLREMENLSDLVMHNLAVTDEGIAHIAALPNLRSLMLGASQLTDEGLMKLAKNPTLKRLSFRDAPGVTMAGLARLRRLRPDIELG